MTAAIAPAPTRAHFWPRLIRITLIGMVLTLALAPTVRAELRNDRPAAVVPTLDYARRADVQAFIAEAVTRHGFEADALSRLFKRAHHEAAVLRLIAPPARTFKRSWAAYRQRFLEPTRIAGGVAFWEQNESALARATERFGVPPEIVVAIIGVETLYGRISGKFRILDALVTLGFDDPRRAAYFRDELEQYLLWTRDAGIDPLSVRGSYAGAIGLPQFMPTSIRHFAVDFDADGVIDLRASASDAVGSVASFLAIHGWQPQAPTHFRALVEDRTQIAALTEAGIEPRFTAAELSAYGVIALPAAPADLPLALIDLPNADEPPSYFLGAQNFYVITRYNRSSFYAMAVLELAQALRAARSSR